MKNNGLKQKSIAQIKVVEHNTSWMRKLLTLLVILAAVAALAMFTLVGAALYGVLERELTRHENDDLNTNLQNMRYSIERFGDLDAVDARGNQG